MVVQRQLPAFASATWYLDPRDPRCPHDAWLESLEVTEPAIGDRQERRKTAITVKLLGAYHDGHILFYYGGVASYQLSSGACGSGLGDWLRDEFAVSGNGLLIHRIVWCGGQKSDWVIEAEDINYEWVPHGS